MQVVYYLPWFHFLKALLNKTPFFSTEQKSLCLSWKLWCHGAVRPFRCDLMKNLQCGFQVTRATPQTPYCPNLEKLSGERNQLFSNRSLESPSHSHLTSWMPAPSTWITGDLTFLLSSHRSTGNQVRHCPQWNWCNWINERSRIWISAFISL